MQHARALPSLSLVALLLGPAPLACSGSGDDGGDGSGTATTGGTTGSSVSGPSPTSGASLSTSTGTTSGDATDTASTDGSTSGGTTGEPTSDATDTGTSSGGVETDSGATTSSTTAADTSSGTTEGGTDTGVDEAPIVLSTTPEDLADAVDPDAKITVTFSEVMNAGTLTTNIDTNCSGTLQVSADNFATCVKMAGPPTSGDKLTFTLTPAAPLSSATTHRIKVLGEVTDMGGTPMGADYLSADGFTIRYYHTIVLDGANDFTVNETFASSTLGQSGFVAWDAEYLYLGMKSPDLASQNSQIWMVGYLGGAMGSNVGVLYNSQQPTLPFGARWHLRWKASDDYGGALEWSGGAWTDVGFGPIAGGDDVAYAGDFLEMRVSWADLQSPDMIEVHLGMLREQQFNEATWAGVPANTYSDGYDPDYAHYFKFDVHGSLTPAGHESL